MFKVEDRVVNETVSALKFLSLIREIDKQIVK